MKLSTSGWSTYAVAAYGAITARTATATATATPATPRTQDALAANSLQTPVAEAGRFLQTLGAQTAAGVPRLPEHAGRVLAAGEGLDWSTEAATRSAVWPGQQALVEATDLLHGSELTQASAMFAVQVNQAIRTYGIAVPPEPVIGMGRDGALQVLNGHPQASRLEGVLRSQDGLSERFALLAVSLNAQRQQAAEGTQLDPMQRVSSHASAGEVAPMYLRVGADGVETFFGMARSFRA